MLTKKEVRSLTAATKITEDQNAKLIKIAKKHQITKSSLIAQLIAIGYKELTKSKRDF